MQRSSKRVIALLVVAAILTSFLSFVAPITKAQTSTKITIMETTDVHGNIYPIDYYTLKPANVGLAKIYTLVQQVRKENPNSILIDNGDVNQGTPLVYYYTKVEPETANPMMTVMNYMGYDAMVVGNHEIQDYGWDWLQKLQKDAKFPFLSANMVDKATDQGVMTPYIIKEVNGVKIGIIGLTTTETNIVTPSYNLKGHWFDDAVTTAGKYIKELRPQVDILIVSAHMGFEWGKDTTNFTYITPLREGTVADTLVQKYPEIDVLITGHDHYNLTPFIRNGVLCIQSYNWGQALGKLDITLEKNGDKWQIVKKEGVNIPVDGKVVADQGVLDIAKEYNDKAVAYVDSTIGEAAGDFDGTLSRIQDNAMLDLIHKVQLEMTGADVSIAAMLPAVLPVWKKGPIKVRDVYSLYIYENTLWVKEVTGKDIKNALESSYMYYNTYDFGKTDSPLVNPNVKVYNFDTLQGMDYVIDISRPVGSRVTSLTYKGKSVTPFQKFKLAVNNYRGNGGGYPAFANDPILSMSDDEIRNTIIDYIKKKGTIYPEVDNNWKIVPDYLLSPAIGDFDTLVRRGVITTTNLGVEVNPDATITRGKFTEFAVKSFINDIFTWKNKPVTFKDVMADNPSYAYILTLAKAGFISGYGKGTFGPYDSITREATSTIFFRLMGIDQGSLSKNFNKAVSLGLFNATDDPRGTLTGADVAKFIVTLRFPVITILHTNDFHMYLLGSTDATTKKPIGGSARIYTLVQRERAYNPNTLLVDAGDIIGGGPPIGAFFYGKDVIETYNAMGYDIATTGNHEFDWGYAKFKEITAPANYEYINANIVDSNTNSTILPPYSIKSFGFVDIGFIGVDTTDLPVLVNPTGIEGLTVLDPTATINNYATSLKDKAEYTVVLSHLGYDVDKTVAAKISNVNLIIGGHSHTVLTKPDFVNGIPIVQTGNYGNNVGKEVVEFVATPTGAKIVGFRYNLIPITDSLPEDPTIKALIAPYNDEVTKKMSVVIGEALVDLDGERANVRSKETNLGDFIADWMKAISGTDIAITNSGGIRASIPKGPITVGSVYTTIPFDNLLVKLELTGKQITAALENGFSMVETAQGRFPQISGITVKVNLKNAPNSRVVEVLVNGKTIELDKVYTVAVLDFMAAGGDGYTAMTQAKSSKWVTGNWMRDDLVDYIKAHPEVNVTVDGRITFVSP
jgi:2',3'-cyclic-nucleotide 2'-phosphodiesterase (5'-nucleotidase family)